MSTRDAVDTIKGYFYQFDYSILKILQLLALDDSITIEGIEDIDINTATESKAIQCKYYSKTEYNHSVIGKPIRYMLSHYKDVKEGKCQEINYHLYGNYSSGHEKLETPIDLEFLKTKFLTHTSDGIKKEHHNDLKLSDDDLNKFLKHLCIDIHALSYDDQYESVINALASEFSCPIFDAEYYYYNNALNEIRKLSIQSNIDDRKISKKVFLERVNNKKILFNSWFVQFKGRKQYFKKIKDEYFRDLNKAPFERFFIIELEEGCSLDKIKELIYIISERYSNLKKREPKTFCPYILLSNINSDDLSILKNQIFDEGYIFLDGHPFLGSYFKVESILKTADFTNKIKFKILNNIESLNETINNNQKTKEIYQFYINNVVDYIKPLNIKDIQIQIEEINEIKEII